MALGIHCCKDCVPPKRHPCCHATCEEYLKQKAQFEEDKKKIRADKENNVTLTVNDFNKTDYIKSKNRGRGRRKKAPRIRYDKDI